MENLLADYLTRRDFVTSATVLAAMVFASRRGTPALAAMTRRPPDPKLVEDLVAANRILADQGILDGYGHVSVRDESAPNHYLMSRDLAPALVSASDILEYDIDSNPIDAGSRAVYRERFIHGEIYRARPDVKAVVHSHAAAVIPFSLSSTPLMPVFHMAAFIVDGVPVFDPSRTPGSHHVLITTPAAGRALAQALDSKGAVLIRGHGAAIVGTSLSMAVGRAIYLEASARIQAQAIALGGKVTYLDPDAAHEAAQNSYDRAWELWKRRTTAGR